MQWRTSISRSVRSNTTSSEGYAFSYSPKAGANDAADPIFVRLVVALILVTTATYAFAGVPHYRRHHRVNEVSTPTVSEAIRSTE